MESAIFRSLQVTKVYFLGGMAEGTRITLPLSSHKSECSNICFAFTVYALEFLFDVFFPWYFGFVVLFCFTQELLLILFFASRIQAFTSYVSREWLNFTRRARTFACACHLALTLCGIADKREWGDASFVSVKFNHSREENSWLSLRKVTEHLSGK